MNELLVRMFFSNGLLNGIVFGLIFGTAFFLEGGPLVGIAVGVFSTVAFGMMYHFADKIGEATFLSLFFGLGIALIFTFVAGFEKAVLIGAIIGLAIRICGRVEEIG